MRLTRTSLLTLALLLAAAPLHAQTTSTEKQSIATPSTAKPQGVMTWDKIAGTWKRFKGGIRRQWGKLTNDDIAVAEGRREILVGRIQARYGIDKDKADQQIDAWMKSQK